MLHAAHVRQDHVHVVLAGEGPPERMLGKLKAYGSRALNRAFGLRKRRWSRHGSTRWLWAPQQVDDAVHYVVNEQGEPGGSYVNPRRWDEQISRRR